MLNPFSREYLKVCLFFSDFLFSSFVPFLGFFRVLAAQILANLSSFLPIPPFIILFEYSHKHTEANGRPQDTPEGFWDLSFADSVRSDVERGRESRGQQRRNQPPHQQRHEPNGVVGGGGMGGLPIGDGSELFCSDGSTSSTLGF